MKRGKKGVNSTAFWSIIIFVLIVAVILIFFFSNVFNFNKIKQIKLGEDDVDLELSNVKITDTGIDFTLDVDPKKEEIIGIKFVFETEDNQTEVYRKDVSYTNKTESFYSIDLNEIDPNKITRVLITPILKPKKADTSSTTSVNNVYDAKNKDFVNSNDYVELANKKSSSSGSSGSSSGGGDSGSGSSTGGTSGQGSEIKVSDDLNIKVSWWKFDVNAQDSIGNNHGQLLEGAKIIIDSERNQVLSLEGIDDYVNVPDSSSLDISKEITLSAWINLNSYTSSGKIIIKPTTGGSDPWELYALDVRSEGTVRFILSNGTSYAQGGWHKAESSTTLSLNEWHHVLGTYDGKTMRIYVNGVLRGTNEVSLIISTNNENLLIGRFITGGNLIDGFIDEVMIFNSSLNSTEVQNIYNSQKQKTSTPESEPTPEPTPTCSDGTKNGDEAGIDCGGSCEPCILEPTCTSHAYSACYSGNVYWYDSCDKRESVKELCTSDESCQNAQCILIEKPSSPVCGNGILESGEFCDGSSLGGETCVSFGFDFGNLMCKNNCQFDVSGCYDEVIEPEPIPEPTPTCSDGIKNGDETGIDCGGSCPACTPLPSTPVSCSGVSCASNEYCLHGVCLLDVPGETYFVAPWGKDSNPGTFEQPWGTWGKSFEEVSAGDITYFRGGLYMIPASNAGYGYRLSTSGTVNAPIRFFNYPDEEPLFDFDEVTTDTRNFIVGIMTNADYISYKGLTFRNLWQKDSTDESYMFHTRGSNIIIEDCSIYNVGGSCFWAGEVYNLTYYNCDASHCVDYLTTERPGDDGYGFMHVNWNTNEGSVYYKNCRAWENGDDGFQATSDSYAEYSGCWSFNNGRLQGGGNGFKMGWISNVSPGLHRLYKNCISAGNLASGFNTNDQGYYSGQLHVYGNIIYHNGYLGSKYWGYGISVFDTLDTNERELLREFKNNIIYKNERGNVWVQSGAFYTHEYNTLDLPVTLTEEDFISLDISQLYAPRKPDGSLPDITFGHLRADSDLIDSGVNVGLPYNGDAPDLGAFESNFGSSETCNCASNEYCLHGVCLLDVPGETYFVAPWGKDSNPGTFEQPWRTWGKAFNANVVDPGDMVYFRGGIYYKNISDGEDNWYTMGRSGGGSGYRITRKGTDSDNMVYYFAYPGEKPILDCERTQVPESKTWLYGIYSNADYCYFKGLVIRNVWAYNTWGKTTVECCGFSVSGRGYIIENSEIYNIHGIGIRIYPSHDSYIINTDAYNCANSVNAGGDPGNRGTGFSLSNSGITDSSIHFKNCRAWLCSDQGFSCYDVGYAEYDGCWSFNNGALIGGGGDGWKLGFKPQGYEMLEPNMYVHDSIAAFNRYSGFNTNDNTKDNISGLNIYNNIAYHNGHYPGYEYAGVGFRIFNTNAPDSMELKRIFKNNLAYKNEGGPTATVSSGLYTHSHNSWDSSLTVTDEDFILLPKTMEEGFALLSAPRKTDGSLPDLGDYFKLSESSDLIDVGVYVGLPYNGAAPDLGAFEH